MLHTFSTVYLFVQAISLALALSPCKQAERVDICGCRPYTLLQESTVSNDHSSVLLPRVLPLPPTPAENTRNDFSAYHKYTQSPRAQDRILQSPSCTYVPSLSPPSLLELQRPIQFLIDELSRPVVHISDRSSQSLHEISAGKVLSSPSNPSPERVYMRSTYHQYLNSLQLSGDDPASLDGSCCCSLVKDRCNFVLQVDDLFPGTSDDALPYAYDAYDIGKPRFFDHPIDSYTGDISRSQTYSSVDKSSIPDFEPTTIIPPVIRTIVVCETLTRTTLVAPTEGLM
ncbi:hypothetical protein BDQ12DRAFT_459577 [Crucibulum laeve]|uniref:Uncharacterized protein n=1 Tax=Crucibulum laeve TaxID=68775 RepID=A0A5C3M7E0_9AGAR|nr:hypothetical protein BDQ12DRAFT_459577 [Crucibulum laeve]